MNSVYNLKDVIQALANEDKPENGFEARCPQPYQWKLLKVAITVLEPLKITTKVFEAEKEPTINKVVERYYFHQEDIDECIKNKKNCNHGIGFAKVLKRNLELRVPDCGTDILENRIANFLDPRLKSIHLMNFEK